MISMALKCPMNCVTQFNDHSSFFSHLSKCRRLQEKRVHVCPHYPIHVFLELSEFKAHLELCEFKGNSYCFKSTLPDNCIRVGLQGKEGLDKLNDFITQTEKRAIKEDKENQTFNEEFNKKMEIPDQIFNFDILKFKIGYGNREVDLLQRRRGNFPLRFNVLKFTKFIHHSFLDELLQRDDFDDFYNEIVAVECDENPSGLRDEFDILVQGKLDNGNYIGVNDDYERSHGETLVLVLRDTLPTPSLSLGIAVVLILKSHLLNKSLMKSVFSNSEQSAWLNSNIIKVEEGEEHQPIKKKEMVETPKEREVGELRLRLEALQRKLALDKECERERLSAAKEKNLNLVQGILNPLISKANDLETAYEKMKTSNSEKLHSINAFRELYREVIDEEAERKYKELNLIFESEKEKYKKKLEFCGDENEKKRGQLEESKRAINFFASENNVLEKSILEYKSLISSEQHCLQKLKSEIAIKEASNNKANAWSNRPSLLFPCIKCQNQESNVMYLPCKHLIHCEECEKRSEFCCVCSEVVEQRKVIKMV